MLGVTKEQWNRGSVECLPLCDHTDNEIFCQMCGAQEGIIVTARESKIRSTAGACFSGRYVSPCGIGKEENCHLANFHGSGARGDSGSRPKANGLG